eukprot:3925698-Amphidinium_carterae.1
MSGQSRLAVTTEDASDYYYGLELPFSLVRTNTVGPLNFQLLYSKHLADGSSEEACVLQSSVKQWGSFDAWSVALVAPPMGDVKAPDIAQCVHSHTSQQAHVLAKDSWMAHGSRAPNGPRWCGCYVDDFSQIAVTDDRLPDPFSTACVTDSEAADQAHENLLGAYRTAHIERKVAKATKDEPTATVWGALLDGPSKRASTAPDKRRILVLATLEACRMTRLPPRLIQVLLRSSFLGIGNIT